MERFLKYKNIFNSTVDRPPVVSVGMDIKPTDATTISLGVKHINNENIKTLGSGPQADGGFGWKNLTVFALGVQHQLNNALTLRAGYNYNNSPIDEEHVFANVLLPAIVEHHFTAGATLKFSNTMEFGWSAFVTPVTSVTDSGGGDSFSANNPGVKLTSQQYGTQLSFKYSF
jgi:long-chain fatty acid transport protein|tara:strand:- start:1543 stop:2058 length:516 start_codon:yes stop_codon:yes gene_type:complete